LLIDQDRDLQLSPTEIAQRDALAILDQHQVPRLDDTADGSAGSGLMHHKFMVVDRQVVVTGSANWTMSDIHGDLGQASSRGNANNLLTIRSAALAQHFTQEFDLMWGDGPGQKPNSRFGLQKPNRGVQTLQVGKSLIQLQFSPTSPTRPWSQSSNGLIGQTLVRSRRSVDLALFVFSDQTLADQLQTLQSRNVQMRTLIDPGFAYRPYSELLDQLGVSLADSQCRYEANNRPWKTPISGGGVPRLWPGDKLHHKFGVVDQRWVITGSQNWSEAANHQNDETLMVIHNPVIAAHYQREFDRLNQAAILGLPPAVLKKQQRQANSCRTAR
jgi:phosphatidylserine/phosphatidylglycerophosphate/cardiolipin synthase-like enzyme